MGTGNERLTSDSTFGGWSIMLVAPDDDFNVGILTVKYPITLRIYIYGIYFEAILKLGNYFTKEYAFVGSLRN